MEKRTFSIEITNENIASGLFDVVSGSQLNFASGLLFELTIEDDSEVRSVNAFNNAFEAEFGSKFKINSVKYNRKELNTFAMAKMLFGA